MYACTTTTALSGSQDSSVMMSSVMPSLKYSCRGSPLRLANASTAMDVPEDKKASLIPSGWFDRWADAAFATDPKGGGKTLRAPNGVAEDFREYWFGSPPKAYWDPARIRSPVLLVVAEWDRESPPYMTQTLFPLLINAPWKRLTVLSEGTHWIAMERNRMLLFRTVQQFLEEPPPHATALQ